MLDRCKPVVVSLLFGCLACLVVTSGVNAEGRVFALDLGNSSGLWGVGDAERACASQRARLASAEELRHAVVECFFSSCARGWLHGGTVGTTVCNTVSSAPKVVDVRTENATEDTAHLDAFCIKDKDVPCGDPPSFPNARLQGHTGFEMGDELLYTCVPGYVMPSGHSAFSLLCDSCGEWYGLVQMCVKGETEGHIDYEDKFTDSYGEEERHSERPEEAHGEVYEEVHGAAYPEGKRSQEQQESSFGVEVEEDHQGEMIGRKFEGDVGGEKDEEWTAEDSVGHPRWEQERRKVVKIDAAATTEASVSLLSQKHMFWFPSEAFQEEGHPVSTNPITQTTQRASGAQSEESKEHESQERDHDQHPTDVDDQDDERESFDDHDTDDHDDHDTDDHDDHDTDDHDDHDTDDHDDHDNSQHDVQDTNEDSHHDDREEHDSHQDEDDHNDPVKHYIPAQHDDLDRQDSHEKHDDSHDDHYDMGEHEDDRVRYGSQEYDDRDDTYDEHVSYEDREDVTDDHGDREHPEGSKEHPDHDDHADGEENYDLKEDDNDRYTGHDDHDHDDLDSYDDHDSHENEDDGHRHVLFSIATDDHQNVTQKAAGGKATTDETWLDGYPVVPEETEKGDSITKGVRPEDRERGTLARTTDRPNEVEIRRPAPYTSSPEEHGSPTMEPEQREVEEVRPGFIPTAISSPDHLEPSDSPSYSDTLDYDTQQAAPTHSWQGGLTERPFLNYGPAPPVHNGDGPADVIEEHTVLNLPGETGERGQVEGGMGETACTGDNCPPRPPSSSSRGPTVAAIIVAVCAVAVAVIVGVWCYRRQQQKSSVYEMNGKGHGQTGQAQQIEMQQKV